MARKPLDPSSGSDPGSTAGGGSWREFVGFVKHALLTTDRDLDRLDKRVIGVEAAQAIWDAVDDLRKGLAAAEKQMEGQRVKVALVCFGSAAAATGLIGALWRWVL